MFRFLILMKRTAALKLSLYNLFSYVAAEVQSHPLLSPYILNIEKERIFFIVFINLPVQPGLGYI